MEMGVEMSTSTVPLRILIAGVVARMPFHCPDCNGALSNIVFSEESRLKLSYNDGRLRVRRYHGNRKLRAYSAKHS